MLQIAQIILVIIRFFFKRYITVCFFVVEFVLEQSANPLYQINDIKEDVTQFFHLSGMYLLVIDCVLVDSYSMSVSFHLKIRKPPGFRTLKHSANPLVNISRQLPSRQPYFII